MRSSSKSPALYEQLAQKIEKLITAGTLRPGERIPSIRRTSRQHDVSVTTAVQAYLVLENRGLVEGRPKSGFFVRAQRRLRTREPATSQPARRPTPVGV